MSTTTAAATTSTTTAVAAATAMPRPKDGDRQQNATQYDRQNSPHNASQSYGNALAGAVGMQALRHGDVMPQKPSV
jgi:hypothetical protein